MKKRILSILLAVAMVVAMVPATLIAAFAEDSVVNEITFVSNAELDGENTNGEYDNATKVMLNAYGNDTDGDNMRIIYTDEAVYVLVEVVDNTVVRYASGSGKCDFLFLGFKLGTSFQGIKRVYRDTTGAGRDVFTAPGAYVNMTDGSSALETNYFGYTEDENGFRLEARFPVDEMSAYDQALYAAGQLELRFTAGTQNGTDNGTEIVTTYDGDVENRDWDGKATEDYFEAGSYKAKNPSAYPEYKFEFVTDEVIEAPITSDYITYVENPTFDGKNTDGEYDDAFAIEFDCGLWGTTPNGNQTIKVVYSDDAIYVLVEFVDSTDGGSSDFFYFHYRVGTTYCGTKLSNRASATNVSEGVNTISGTAFPQSSSTVVKNITSEGWSIEFKLSIADLNEADRAAFEAGTLDVAFGGSYCDDWGKVYMTDSYGSYANATAAEIASLTALTFLAKPEVETPEVTGPQIPYASSATLDGNKTEYANALQIPMTYAGAGWVAKAPDANDVAYVVYTDDAIYVYVTADCGTLGSWDMTAIGFKIGSSYVGSNAAQSNAPAAYLFSTGASTVDASFFAVDAAVNLEARFPVSGMTAEDQAAFANGTLEVAFNFMNMDGYAFTASFDLGGSYSAYTSASGSATYVMPNLTTYALEVVELEEVEVPFAPNVKLDGANTDGEYDKAPEISLNTADLAATTLPSGYNGTSSGTVPAGSYYKVVYAEDGIYVFVNIADTTPAYYGSQGEGIQGQYYYVDQMSITYSIGTSFVGKDWSYRHGTMGATNTGAGTLSGYPSTQKDNNAEGWTYEIKFPYSGMTAEDKAAFTDGTLEIALNVTIADRTSNDGWGWYNGVIYTAEETYKYVLGEGPTNYKDSIVFDGANTDGEYAGATIITYPYGLWGFTPTGAEANMKVVYTNEAIYVLVTLVDSSPNVGTEDFHRLHISIGESFIGSKLTNKDSLVVDEDYTNVGGAVDLKPYQSELFKETHTETGYTLEARFPVSLMTETDKAAFAAGTLRVAFGGAHCNDWSVSMTQSGGTYNAAGASYLASLPAIKLDPRTTKAGLAGANLSLGQNINVNYYANIPYDKVSTSYVKFTYNGSSIIVAPVANPSAVDSYIFAFEGLAPQCMGDNIRAVLVIDNKPVSMKETYSALDNCKNLLGKHGDKVDQLIYDLLAYGAAAQEYAGYKTNALVNAGYEDKASVYDLYPSTSVALDGVDTDGEYDNAITVAIDKALAGSVTLPDGAHVGTSSGTVPAGSYYKVLFTDEAIFVYVNIADTTPAYYGTQGEGLQGLYYFADQVALNYSIGESFVGKDWAYRHGTMGATNTGAGSLSSYPSTQKDNNAEGWSYEIMIPVSGMTDADKAAYAAGTLSIKFNVEIADRTSNDGWGWYNGVIYSDNATTDAYTTVSLIDKVVGAPTVDGAAFSAAGVYHGNANKVYAKVSLNGSKDISAYSVTIDGVEAIIEETATKGVYIIYTDDVKVYDFDKVFTFVLSDGTNSQTLQYSINAYSIIKATGGKTEATKNIAKALYNYGMSAEAYIAG